MTWIEIEAFEMAARLEATGVYPARADELAVLNREVVERRAPDRATWMRARQPREEIVAQTVELFADTDFLCTPTVARAASSAEDPWPLAGAGASTRADVGVVGPADRSPR